MQYSRRCRRATKRSSIESKGESEKDLEARRSLTPHYEHTIVITKGRPLVLTAA